MSLLSWIRRWHDRRDCFHHNVFDGESWIDSHLIDTGMRKLFRCTRCQKMWIA